ncbi:MAG: histidine phosphatase family protein [Thermoplasmatota archaeon]
MEPTRLWFMRHGEVEAPYVGAFVGRTEVNLSPVGRHQAEAIAAYLEDAPVDAVVSSPRKRALDTAAPLARARSMKLEVRRGFAEMDYGRWEGLFWKQIEEQDPVECAAWVADAAARPMPDGESCDGFSLRVRDELSRLLEEFTGRTVAVFGHAGTNRAILGTVLERPFRDCFTFVQDYGNVNAAAWLPGGGAQVALANFVPGPRSEKSGD